MSDFILSLLDFCFIPFRFTDNLLVFVPFVSLLFVFLFGLISRLMRGNHS